MRLLLVLIAAPLLPGCHMPRDPDGTLDHVRGGSLRAGLSITEPWTRFDKGQPAGVEVRLLDEFASELGANIDWVVGSESELLTALERQELDVVIGGLTDDTPWKSRVGLTRPYLATRLVVGVPVEQPLLSDIRGKEVAVRKGRVAIAARVRKADGIPIPVNEPSSQRGPVAADRWQIQVWGLKPCEVHLHKDKHVMAVPPGENGWLMSLEWVLRSHSPRIQEIIQSEAGR